jgi:hypothetical protein
LNFKVREIRETSICRDKDRAKEEGKRGRGEEGERGRGEERKKPGFRLVMALKLASRLP